MEEIHVSEVKAFKDCRWRWEWSSSPPHGRYLERDIPVPYFMLGRAVHYAMDQYYSGKDAVAAYQRYIEKDLELVEHLQLMEGDEKSKIVDNVETGLGMVEHYISWAPAHDIAWDVVATELPFEVPMVLFGQTIPDTNWGGRFDGVWRRKSDGTLWLKEFKTAASIKDIDWVYKDEQPMFYAWAAEQVFKEPIAGVLYTFLRKAIPDRPNRLKNGDLSKARNQHTTAALYMDELRADARGMAGDDEEKYNKILNDYLVDYGETIQYFLENQDYFLRKTVEKSKTQLLVCLEGMQDAARDMLSRPILYPAPSPAKCRGCPFKLPCDVRMSGGDYNMVLASDFRPRTPWEAELEDERAA